jgi:hypothetical protein
MVKATIRTKSGTEIEIESDRQTIMEIISTIQRREELRERFREESKRRHEEVIHRQSAAPVSATGFILRLEREGFFKEKRTLGEIQSELQKNGYMYPLSTLSAVMLRLIRHGDLERIKDEDKWRYVQR